MLVASLTLLALPMGAFAGNPLSPAFTYQGQLKSAGVAYNGTADLTFTLFDAASGGNALGSALAANNVSVTNGVFSVSLDFGGIANAFNGDNRWLAIAVHTPSNGGAGPYTSVTPRQRLAAAPYALRALSANIAGLQPSAISFNNAANNYTGSTLDIDANTLRVDSAGHRVGIGVTAPAAKLHVSAGSSGIVPNPDSTLVVENYFTNYLSMLTSAGYPSGILFGQAGAANQQATAGLIFNSPSVANGLDFRTGGDQTRMVIDSGGNIGMGTVTPAAPLEVSRAQAGSGPLLQLRNPQQNSTSAMRFSQPTRDWLIGQNLAGSADVFSIRDETAGVTHLAINGFSGNVGINTTSPIDVFTVRGSGTAITAYDGYVMTRLFSSAQTAKGYVGTSSPTGFVLRTDDQDRMIIDPNGNVGIGTLTPTQLFSVNGSAGKPGGGSWATFSDARLKTNVHDLDGALDSLLALRGVTFEYKDPAAINERPGEHIGMIAQEVEQVFPQWVSQATPDGYKQLAFSGFEALTVEALRELRAEKDAQLAARDAQIADLRQSVAELQALLRQMHDTGRSP